MVPAQSLVIPPTSVGGIALVGGRGVIVGYAFRESTNGAVADFDVLDGQTAAGNPLIPFTLDPHESDRQWFGGGGILFQNGLFVNVIAGTIRGTVYVILEEVFSQAGIRVVFGQSDTAAEVPLYAGAEIERY